MRRQIAAGIIVMALSWVSGCGMPANPSELIRPPSLHLYEDQSVSLIQPYLPDGARLLSMMNGSGDPGIVFGDVDGDGELEAVVVYEAYAPSGRLKAALLKRVEHEWQVIWETDGSGYGLDYAVVSDVNWDGVAEVVLGWSLGAAGNGLDVYRWSGNTLKLQLRQDYEGKLDFRRIDWSGGGIS